ncbi:retrovirus-related Pol polyprotein from transposon TNT 1-94, partial [Trifolium medium]|nr:retrovirus-related Pol polyprotein from transposon TNT 1-94 [Trifolium medium]
TSDNAVNDEGELIHFAPLADSKPVNFRDALKGNEWKKAMEEELKSIKRNQTWKLVALPDKKKKIDVKWVFKVKLNPDGKNTVIICLYVDDLLITGSKASEIEELKCKLKSEFEMTDLGKLSYFLGMEFVKVQDGIVMHPQKYINELLEKFEMNGCNSISIPSETNTKLDECSNEEKVDSTMLRQIVGTLRYVRNSRPDICYSVSVISKFMHDPRKSQLAAAKRIFWYLKGTLDYEWRP